jgi:hypothetical protein
VGGARLSYSLDRGHARVLTRMDEHLSQRNVAIIRSNCCRHLERNWNYARWKYDLTSKDHHLSLPQSNIQDRHFMSKYLGIVLSTCFAEVARTSRHDRESARLKGNLEGGVIKLYELIV